MQSCGHFGKRGGNEVMNKTVIKMNERAISIPVINYNLPLSVYSPEGRGCWSHGFALLTQRQVCNTQLKCIDYFHLIKNKP